MQRSPCHGGGARYYQLTIDDYIAELAKDVLPVAPQADSSDVSIQLRGVINEVIRESKLSRDEIADPLSDNLIEGQKISKAQMDSWTRADSDRHIPIKFMFAFERACSSTALKRALA